MQRVIQKECIKPRGYINEMAVVKEVILHGQLVKKF
jgi:hypothetical protein